MPAEFKRKHDKGAVAMARMPDVVNPKRASNGSQFYIAWRDLPNLDGGYTVFGKVIAGWQTVMRIVALADRKDIARVDDNANPGRLALIKHAHLGPLVRSRQNTATRADTGSDKRWRQLIATRAGLGSDERWPTHEDGLSRALVSLRYSLVDASVVETPCANAPRVRRSLDRLLDSAFALRATYSVTATRRVADPPGHSRRMK